MNRTILRFAWLLGTLVLLVPISRAAEPQSSTGLPWVDMDYGPFLTASIEAPWPGRNIAYKGIAVPIHGPGGGPGDKASQAAAAIVFDTDLLRYSVGWKGDFLHLRGVVFDGTHYTYPQINGDPVFANPVAPGWAKASVKPNAFEDPRPLPYGPLPRDWAHFKGLYLHSDEVVFSYTVGRTAVLETPGIETVAGTTAFTRELNLGPTEEDLIIQVAFEPGGQPQFLSSLSGKAAAGALAVDSIVSAASENRKTAAAATGDVEEAVWLVTPQGDLRLKVAASRQTRRIKILIWSGRGPELGSFAALVNQSAPVVDLKPLTGGGPPRWPQKLVYRGELGSSDGPYAMDTITWPGDNPYNSWMRFGGFDFFSGGQQAAICTWNGDVWIVSGIGPRLQQLTWQRIATGLFQPLGLKIVDGKVYVLGRDQITILHDLNGDGEADFYENFNNDHQVTEHFHEFAMDLQQDSKGDFYYMKGGRHALDSLIPQHGTMIRVARDGFESNIVASGFRAPNGLLITPQGNFISSDQQGHWIPANRINLIKPGGFYGYMWSYHQGERPSSFDPPLAWIHPGIDRSPSTFVSVDSDRWGPFENRIISLSYGMGKVDLLLQEEVDGIVQGGVTRFPLDFQTGVMRGRFHPVDGQLYLCGLFGWAGNKTQPGGFYRVRYTGGSVHMPTELRVARDGVVIRFVAPLDPVAATEPGNYHVQAWNYHWSENYGSADYKLSGEEGRDQLPVESVTLSSDRRSVFLRLSGLTPVDQMQIDFNLKGSDGAPIRNFVHNTVHAIGNRSGREMLGGIWITGARSTGGVKIDSEAPGLIQEIRSSGGESVQPDTRRSRLAALYVAHGEPASPLLPAGPFRVRWRGFLRMDLSEEVRFRVQGRGAARLRVEEREVSFPGSEQDVFHAAPSEPVSLRGGLNRIAIDYESPRTGDAIFRLHWFSSYRVEEPLPPGVFVHDAKDLALREGESVRRGRQLFAGGRCNQCHLPWEPFGDSAMPELGFAVPSLDGIGGRFKRVWLQRWILNPRSLRHDSMMPEVLHGSPRMRETAAVDIAAFLGTLTSPGKSVPSPAPETSERAGSEILERGKATYDSLGCIACHTLSDTPAPPLVSLRLVESKWHPQALVSYLLEPEEEDPWSSMPNYRLREDEARSLAGYLISRSRAHGSFRSSSAAGDVSRGRALVASSGCLNCHEISGLASTMEAPPLSKAKRNRSTGCLAPAGWEKAPRFSFDQRQRTDLESLLASRTDSLWRRSWMEFATRQRDRLQCQGCHDLDATKGRWSPLIARFGKERALQAGTNEEETIHLKIPPITFAGEQFQPNWMEQLLAGSLATKTRPRLSARMPSFPSYAAGLVRGLAAEHGFAPLDETRPMVNEQLREAGRLLVNHGALGCVQCHSVHSHPALAGADTETIDLDLMSRRLRHPFYLRFMREPQQVLNGTMMPTFMVGDRSTLKTVYDGDGEKQLQALWDFMRSLGARQ